RVGQVLNVDVSVRDVFDAPSVRELAAATMDRGSALAPIVAVSPRPERIPLSFAQQRMWFINQFEPDQPTYNLPIGVKLAGNLDVDALRAGVVDVIVRHEVLRTTFPSIDGDPVQLIHDEAWASDNLDWSVVASEAEVIAAAMRGFDVTRESPLRIVLWKRERSEWALLAVLHHIAGDGESMRPLIGDVMTAYQARVTGTAPDFAPLEVQFADYAIWQHTMLGAPGDPSSVSGKQLAYWTRQLAGVPDVLNLPTDRPRPRVASSSGAVLSDEVPTDLARRINELASAHGVTSFMVLHAALAVLLARLSATDDIAIATPIAGRGDRVLDPLVGMFVNTLALRTQIEPGMSFAELLDHVRHVDLDAFAAADVPFESVVEAVNPVRSEAFAPLAQVMLAVDHRPEGDGDGGIEFDGLYVTPMRAPAAFAQVDLLLRLAVFGDRPWGLEITYATDLFDEASVGAIARRYIALLDALTTDPGAAVGDAPIMDEIEEKRLIGWSSGPEALPGEQTVTWMLTRPPST
ncbi:condensation domain-containing protein, partial [Gordonia sp. ABSL49_1]